MEKALNAVKAGETIVMQRDYVTSSTQNSGYDSYTIDLNKHTWTFTDTNVNNAAFEINYSNVTLTVKNGTVVSNSMVGLIPSAMGGTITYDNAGLVFEDVTMTANGHSGIETNGNNTNDTVTLKNSTLDVPNGFGIYFPSSGTLTIDNSTITAKTMGVQVCAGSLSINAGSAITVSGDAVSKTENDGAIQDGAAVSIINRSYPGGTPTATIAGGTFTSANGIVAVQAYTVSGTTASEWTDVAEYVNISGGTFSSIPDNMAALCKVGYRAVEDKDNNVYIVKEANIAIQVTSRIKDDGVTTVSTTTGGGMYCKGEEVTVTTSNVVGFKFLGWYEMDSYATPLSADLSYTFTASKDCTLVALYSPAENATLTVKVTASAFRITGSKWVQNNGGMYKLPVGSSVTVTYTDDTYTFLYWVNGSDKIVSTSPEYTFTLGSNTELRACTSPKNTSNDNAMVVFKTAYDQVLTAKRYGNDEEIVFPMGPSKTGYKFIGWSMTQAEIRAAMAEHDYIVVTPEYETLGSKYTVTVKYEGIGKADDTHTINVGDSILLTAETEVDGKTFSCWKIGDEVVSYLTTLTVFDTEDVTVTAMYGEKVTAEATIRITGVTTGRNGNYYQLIFSESYAVPETATFVQTGFVGTASAATAENLTLDTGTPFVSKLDVPEGSYEYTMNLSRPTMTVYMKAYVQYMENGKLQTLYSDMVSASYNSLTEGGNN